MRYINNKYPCHIFFNIQQSFGAKEYICKNCDSKVIKRELPCQAVVNNNTIHNTGFIRKTRTSTNWFSIFDPLELLNFSFCFFYHCFFFYVKFLKLELYVLFIATKHGLKAEQRTTHDTFSLLVCYLFSHGFMLNKQVPACDHRGIKDSGMPTEWPLFPILVYGYDQFQYDCINHYSLDKHHQHQLSYPLQCGLFNA